MTREEAFVVLPRRSHSRATLLRLLRAKPWDRLPRTRGAAGRGSAGPAPDRRVIRRALAEGLLAPSVEEHEEDLLFLTKHGRAVLAAVS